MNFEWYEELSSSNEMTQGDIIKECPIPLISESMYIANLQDTVEEIDEPVVVKTANLIVMTQACDLANDKLESILLCAIWPLNEIMNLATYFKSSTARESLRQGREPAYHLLQKYKTSNYEMDFSVVDFHHIYTLPKEYLLKVIEGNNSKRLRLLPPYREHLSQAFARYFMRVGLPLAISTEEIKNYSNK